MALKPRSDGAYPLNRSIPLDRESDAKMKVYARQMAITVTELARRFIHEGIARLDSKK